MNDQILSGKNKPLPTEFALPDGFHGFLTLPLIRDHGGPLKSRPFEIAEDLWFYTKVLQCWIKISQGYRTDLSTVPRFFWRAFPPAGQGRWGSYPHDFLCDADPKICINVEAAEIFREFMILEGCPENVWKWKYRAVRYLGPRWGRPAGLVKLDTPPKVESIYC